MAVLPVTLALHPARSGRRTPGPQLVNALTVGLAASTGIWLMNRSCATAGDDMAATPYRLSLDKAEKGAATDHKFWPKIGSGETVGHAEVVSKKRTPMEHRRQLCDSFDRSLIR